MKILLSNDDGIDAEGLTVLRDIARELTTPENIWEVAPLTNQSGVGHCISYMTPLQMERRGERRFAVNGYPADCVLVALGEVMSEPPDLILSGVNDGNNSGQNTLYSGTIGAAMEGALQGIRSIALSQYYGPRLKNSADRFETARAFGPQIIKTLLNADWTEAPYRRFYNVNFAPVPAAEIKGTRVIHQGFRPSPFSATKAQAPNGRDYIYVAGGAQHIDDVTNGDVSANLDGYISITPMTADLTEHAALRALQSAFDLES